MKFLKAMIRSVVVIILISIINFQNVNAEWKKCDGDKWWYNKGKNYSVGWEKINNAWYYFGEDGYMKTGWIYDLNDWYYIDSDGCMKIGWIEYDNKWYYLYSDGRMAKDINIDGYTLGSDGAWVSTKEKIYDGKEYELMAKKYIISKGYTIVSNKGETDRYILNKSMIYGSAKASLYGSIWGLQSNEPDKYFGKEIGVYGFTVKNHPLEKIYGVKSSVYIMICEGKVIGGFSCPSDDIVASNYSLDGKTLEEVSGISYEQWSSEWEAKYKS